MEGIFFFYFEFKLSLKVKEYSVLYQDILYLPILLVIFFFLFKQRIKFCHYALFSLKAKFYFKEYKISKQKNIERKRFYICINHFYIVYHILLLSLKKDIARLRKSE